MACVFYIGGHISQSGKTVHKWSEFRMGMNFIIILKVSFCSHVWHSKHAYWVCHWNQSYIILLVSVTHSLNTMQLCHFLCKIFSAVFQLFTMHTHVIYHNFIFRIWAWKRQHRVTMQQPITRASLPHTAYTYTNSTWFYSSASLHHEYSFA